MDKKDIMKKISSTLLIVCMTLSLITVFSAVTKADLISFPDVNDQSKAYYKPVYWAVEQQIIVGYKDGTFRPGNTVTRSQVATMLWRMSGKPSASAKAPFKDVDSSGSAYRPIQWGSEAGVIKGYKDNTFRPANDCLRQHIVTFLYRYARDVLGEKVN